METISESVDDGIMTVESTHAELTQQKKLLNNTSGFLMGQRKNNIL